MKPFPRRSIMPLFDLDKYPRRKTIEPGERILRDKLNDRGFDLRKQKKNCYTIISQDDRTTPTNATALTITEVYEFFVKLNRER